VAGAIILLDQATKYLVRTYLPFGVEWAPWPWMEDYVRLVYWKNTGAAFGLFQDFGPVFSVLAVIVSITILYYFPLIPKKDWLIRVVMGLLLAGALGNLIDRATQNMAVTDFISVGNFAVFNVADASITIGVLLLVVALWIKENQEKAEKAAAQAANAEPAASKPEE
jgi:signal peptidase II